jgi:hypothetical protein
VFYERLLQTLDVFISVLQKIQVLSGVMPRHSVIPEKTWMSFSSEKLYFISASSDVGVVCTGTRANI